VIARRGTISDALEMLETRPLRLGEVFEDCASEK
jgi:hypothetical protein